MSNDNIECVRKGNYLVIKGTNVAVHDTEDKIIGIVVQVEEEWMIFVPPKPTKAMLFVSSEYCYELPKSFEKEQVQSALQKLHDEVSTLQRNIHDEISQLQRNIHETDSIKSMIETVQHMFQ